MNKKPSITLAEACAKIAREEHLNQDVVHYLNGYDLTLHVIFGIDLYHGAELCARAAWTIRAKNLRDKNEELRNKGK